MEGILTPDTRLGKTTLSNKHPHSELLLRIHRSAMNMTTLHFASIIHYGSLGVGIHTKCV